MSDYNDFDQINDHTSLHLGAAARTDSLAAAPVGTRVLPPSGPSPEGGLGDATTPAVAQERSLTDADAPSASLGAPQARQTPAVTQTAPPQDGASTPSAPSPENWQRRVLRALLADCRDQHNTRYGVLTGPEVEAIEDLIAASLGWTRTRDQ
jgi:hypothetical protein